MNYKSFIFNSLRGVWGEIIPRNARSSASFASRINPPLRTGSRAASRIYITTILVPGDKGAPPGPIPFWN
jgi:hypothetical protein